MRDRLHKHDVVLAHKMETRILGDKQMQTSTEVLMKSVDMSVVPLAENEEVGSQFVQDCTFEFTAKEIVDS